MNDRAPQTVKEVDLLLKPQSLDTIVTQQPAMVIEIRKPSSDRSSPKRSGAAACSRTSSTRSGR